MRWMRRDICTSSLAPTSFAFWAPRNGLKFSGASDGAREHRCDCTWACLFRRKHTQKLTSSDESELGSMTPLQTKVWATGGLARASSDESAPPVLLVLPLRRPLETSSDDNIPIRSRVALPPCLWGLLGIGSLSLSLAWGVSRRISLMKSQQTLSHVE